MKKIIPILFLFFFFCSFFNVGILFADDDLPFFRVDINKYGRSVSEGLNTNFTAWTFVSADSAVDSLVNSEFPLDTIVVTLCGKTLAGVDTTVWTNYYKAGITSTTVTNDAKLTLDGAFSRVLEMTLHGLPAGTNTLLTYHNNTDAASAYTYNPIRIYVNGTLAVDSLMPTVRELVMSSVPVSYLTFNVDSGQDVVIRFEPILVNPVGGVVAFNCVPLNGFEINTPNSMHQAYSPYPTDKDLHVDGDAGNVKLLWYPATTAVSHNFYFGTDSATVAAATIDSSCFIGNRTQADTTYTVSTYSMDKYYWRVDEIASDGTITKGNTWYFRTRHLAFPDAEGYGRYAEGGRGGIVVHVTTLEDSVAGSFREAVTNTGGVPRTVVFDVSGIIKLKSRISMAANITVAGQTAPGKGICFRAAPIGVNDESVCRFIRMRLGSGETYDGIGMGGANYSIMDHCSISWTIDEAFSSRSAKNITLQRSLISEALNIAGHKNYAAGTKHGYAGSISGNTGSFHHNLLAHNEGRNWSMAGGLDGNGDYAGKLDIFNMVVYNWGGRANDGGANEVNFVNNYYKKGPATTMNYIMNAQIEGTGNGSQSYYYHGNIKAAQDGTILCDSTDNTSSREYTLSNGQVLDWTVFVDTAFFPHYAKLESAVDAYKSVLSDVGCTLPLFDDHDKRIVQETLNGTYTYTGSVSGDEGLIDTESDTGGYEDYPEETRSASFDTDGDGLPDWWEELIGTSTTSASGDFSDTNADNDKDGYTNLDDYLEWMSHPHYDAELSNSLKIDLGQYIEGYTSTPTITFPAQTNCSVSLVSGTDTAVVVPSAKGLASFKFTVTDANGSTYTQAVNLHVTDDGSGIVSESEKKFSIYPTLASNKVYVSGFDNIQNEITLQVVNPTGQTVLTKNVYASSEGTASLTVSNLSQGVYFITDGKNGFLGRFVKK